MEEHFYILLTVGLTVLARRGGADPFRHLPQWILGTCASILGLRIATWYWFPQTSDFIHVTPSHLRMDSLLWGVLLSYFSVFRPGEIRKLVDRFGAWLPQVSILLLSPVAFLEQSDPFLSTFGFSMIAIGFVLLLVSVLYPHRPPARKAGRIFQAMAGLGQVSYAFYLWHGPVLFADDRILAKLMTRGFIVPIAVNLALTFGVTLAIAFLTTRLVEQPLLRLRDRWFPSRTQASLMVAANPKELEEPIPAAPLLKGAHSDAE